MAISSEDVEAIKEELREELREEVKEDLREEFSPRGRSRRDVLKMGGAALGGAALGSVGGAAGAVGVGDERLDVGDVTPNTYRITGNWYGGPATARSELVFELGAADTGARYGADDTGAWYYWTGSGWTKQPLEAPSIDAERLDIGNAITVNGETISDVGQYVSNRVSDGVYRIHITEPADESSISWDTDQTFDFNSLGHGIHLSFDPECEIEYTGTGTALHIDNSWDPPAEYQRLRLVGGYWTAPNDLDRFVRVDDSFGTFLWPNQMDATNSEGTAECVDIRNVGSFSEEGRVGVGARFKGDRGIVFRDTGDTGGSGTDSFHGWSMHGATFSCSDYCVRTSGVFQYIRFVGCTFQPNANGADGVLLDGQRHDGTAFYGPKFESPPDPGSVYAFEIGPNYDAFYPPMSFGGEIGFGMTGQIRSSGPRIENWRPYGKAARLETWNGDDSNTPYIEYTGGAFTISDSNGSATLSLGSDGVLEVDDANGSRDL